MPMIILICEQCKKDFIAIRKNIKFCSKECKQKTDELKNSNKLEGKEDILKCLECGLNIGKSLNSHLRNKHNMIIAEYKQKHNVGIEAIYAQSTRKKLSELNSGENNAWYNHCGKMSPFSKNNNRINEEERKDNQHKAIQNRIDNGNNVTSLEYYLKKTNGNQQEARQLLKERQTTFSLEKCISKYGEDEGKRIWLERQEKWQNTLCDKSQEEINIINGKKRQSRYSKISQHLFRNLNKSDARYHELNGEIGIKCGKKIFYPDFVLDKKIIEFYGDRWHANPKKYDKDEYIKNLSKNRDDNLVSDIWSSDYVRINQLIDLGYEVLIIWEHEYKSNPEKVINKCLNFLNKEIYKREFN